MIGSSSSPILVNTAGQIFAGAGGSSVGGLADFQGTAGDNTVHSIPTNIPCIIIFNDAVLKDCRTTPIPPVVPVAPQAATPPFSVAGVGFDSSWFNLASDYFFFCYFFDEKYVHRKIAIYIQTGSKAASFKLYKMPKWEAQDEKVSERFQRDAPRKTPWLPIQ